MIVLVIVGAFSFTFKRYKIKMLSFGKIGLEKVNLKLLLVLIIFGSTCLEFIKTVILFSVRIKGVELLFVPKLSLIVKLVISVVPILLIFIKYVIKSSFL